MLKVLRLMTYVGVIVILLEGVSHYLLQHEGSIL